MMHVGIEKPETIELARLVLGLHGKNLPQMRKNETGITCSQEVDRTVERETKCNQIMQTLVANEYEVDLKRPLWIVRGSRFFAHMLRSWFWLCRIAYRDIIT